MVYWAAAPERGPDAAAPLRAPDVFWADVFWGPALCEDASMTFLLCALFFEARSSMALPAADVSP